MPGGQIVTVDFSIKSKQFSSNSIENRQNNNFNFTVKSKKNPNIILVNSYFAYPNDNIEETG